VAEFLEEESLQVQVEYLPEEVQYHSCWEHIGLYQCSDGFGCLHGLCLHKYHTGTVDHIPVESGEVEVHILLEEQVHNVGWEELVVEPHFWWQQNLTWAVVYKPVLNKVVDSLLKTSIVGIVSHMHAVETFLDGGNGIVI
jgi:hypothetical protein